MKWANDPQAAQHVENIAGEMAALFARAAELSGYTVTPLELFDWLAPILRQRFAAVGRGAMRVVK
jgi:hypothetical protein